MAARLTRRTALGMLLAGTGLSLAAACAPISTPAAPTAAPAAKPTEAPKPAAPAATTAPATKPAAGAATAPAAPAAAAKPAEAPKPAARPAVQPRSGGTLRIASTLQPVTLDGHLVTPANYDAVWLAHDRLARYDHELKLQPMLAESWELSDDFRQIKLNLRKGVQFHSGREFTSEDVRWNILRVRQPVANTTQFVAQSNWFQTIETPDKYTAILTSDQPRPLVFDFLTFLNMLDPVTMGGPDAAKTAVGTGPFQFVEWQPGVQMRFVKNKNYWQSGKPYLDEVLVTFAGDPQSAVVQFEAGANDAIIGPPVREVARLRSDNRFTTYVNETSGRYFLVVVNTTLPPFDNKLFRQAVNHAIDRRRFVDTVLLGIAEPRVLPWVKQSPAYEAAKAERYPFDLEKAKALLAQSGVANAEFNFNAQSARPEMSSFGQILQADLQQIGVKVNVRGLERAAWEDELNNLKHNMSMGDSAPRGVDPSSLMGSSVYWNAARNSSGFKSETYTTLLSSAGSEPDPAKRKQIYSQLNDLVLDESFAMPVASSPRAVVSRTNLQGVQYDGTESVYYTEMFLSA